MKNKAQIESSVKSILESLGQDTRREGLKDTPRRVAEALSELTEGYAMDPRKVLQVEFNETTGIVICKDVEFFSLCEHHLLPFFGRVHIGYIPNGKVVGLSKLVRLVDGYSKRLQLQERMTKQLVEAIDSNISPMGVIVVVEAEHLCMRMRGVAKGSRIITSEIRGQFQDSKSRQEFFELLRH
jgi:GTP cyclohydrolase I